MHALQAALSPWVALAGLLLAVLIVVAPEAILGLLVRILRLAVALRAVGQQEGGLVPHLEEVGGLLGELLRVAEHEPGMAGQDLDPVRVTDQGLGIAEQDEKGGGYGRLGGPIAPDQAAGKFGVVGECGGAHDDAGRVRASGDL
jgi:hypothetical protein